MLFVNLKVYSRLHVLNLHFFKYQQKVSALENEHHGGIFEELDVFREVFKTCENQ